MMLLLKQARLGAVGLLCASHVAAADPPWAVEVLGGSAYNLRTTLTLRQAGFDELRLRAHYETRPFRESPYYSWRFSHGNDRGAWELQFLHHKLYLADPPPEIRRFEITHGFNVLTVGRSWIRSGWVLRLGGGVVVARPDSTVRGKLWLGTGGLFDRGYFPTGPTARAGLGRRWALARRLFLTPDIELTLSRARVPIVDGDASAPNAALHARVGLGYRF